MKQWTPGFWDYPEIWGAIAGSAVSLVILAAVVFFGRNPTFVDTAVAVAGFSMMGWLFAAARMWVLMGPNRHR